MSLDVLLAEIFAECKSNHEVMLDAVASYLSVKSSLYAGDYKTLLSTTFSKYEQNNSRNVTPDIDLNESRPSSVHSDRIVGDDEAFPDKENDELSNGAGLQGKTDESLLNHTENDASIAASDIDMSRLIKRKQSVDDMFGDDDDIFIPETQRTPEPDELYSDSDDFIQVQHDTNTVSTFDDMQSQNLCPQLNKSSRISCINNKTNDSISLTSTHISGDLSRAPIESDMEMSALKWNESETATDSSKRFSQSREIVVSQARSTSTTPDIDIYLTAEGDESCDSASKQGESTSKKEEEAGNISAKSDEGCCKNDEKNGSPEKRLKGGSSFTPEKQPDVIVSPTINSSPKIVSANTSPVMKKTSQTTKIYDKSAEKCNQSKQNDIDAEHVKSLESSKIPEKDNSVLQLEDKIEEDEGKDLAEKAAINKQNEIKTPEKCSENVKKDNQATTSNKAPTPDNAADAFEDDEDFTDFFNKAAEVIPTKRDAQKTGVNNKENEIIDFDAPTQIFAFPPPKSKSPAAENNGKSLAADDDDIYMISTQVFSPPKKLLPKTRSKAPAKTFDFMANFSTGIRETNKGTENTKKPAEQINEDDVYNVATQCITMPEETVRDLITDMLNDDNPIFDMQTQVFPSSSTPHKTEEAPKSRSLKKDSSSLKRKSEIDRESPETQEGSIAKQITKDIGTVVEKKKADKQKSKPIKQMWLFVSSSDEEGIDELMKDDDGESTLKTSNTSKSSKASSDSSHTTIVEKEPAKKTVKRSAEEKPSADVPRSTKRRNSERSRNNVSTNEDSEPKSKKGLMDAEVVLKKLQLPSSRNSRSSKESKESAKEIDTRKRASTTQTIETAVVLKKIKLPVNEIRSTKEYSAIRKKTSEVNNKNEVAIDRSRDSKRNSRDTSLVSNVSTCSNSSLDSNSSVRRSARPHKPHIMFTRVDFAEIDYRQIVENMGGKVVDDINTCTVLVTNKIVRTCKFLCAMAKGIPIVSSEWLLAIKTNKNKIIETDRFILNDPETEKRYEFKLQKTLDLAVHAPLLKDYVVFVTPSVKPPPDEIKEIVQCAGGRCYTNYAEHSKSDRMFVVSAKEDKQIWTKYKMFYKGIPVVTTEGFMLSIMRHKIDFKLYTLTR